MPYELHNRPDSTVEISAHLDPTSVEEERVTLLKQLRNRVRVPGFRPGRAPLQVVRARLGNEIHEDLVKRLASRLWREVMEEGGLHPISDLRVQRADLDDDGTFRLEGVVDVRPEYELPDTDKVTIPEHPIEVSDAELNEELEHLAEEHASWEAEEEEPAADGMVAETVIRGEITDDEEAEDLDLGEIPLLIGKKTLGEEVDAALQGAKPGDERTADVEFPEDHPDSRLAGHTVHFSLEVKALRRKVLPELDDDLAKAIGVEEGVEELKKRVGTAIEARKKAERRRAWRRAILEQLEEGLDPANLPPTVVEAAMKDAMDGVAFNLMMRGVDPRSEEVDWQKIATDVEPEARKNALDRLVLEQLAEKWEVATPEEDVEAYIAQEAARSGVPVGEHRARLESEGRMEGIRRAAQLTKVVDRLIETAGGETD